MNSVQLPKIIRLLLRIFLPSNDYEFLIEDYELLYQLRFEKEGEKSAQLWLFKYLLKTVPQFAIQSIFWGITMLKNYFKVAVRNFERNKFYSVINITGLAIGMACTILILFWVMHELSYDKFHENCDNIYSVIRTDTHNGEVSKHTKFTPPVLAKTLVDEYPEISFATRFMYTGWAIKYGENLENIYSDGGVFVDPDFFKIFSCDFIEGNHYTALNSPTSIVLTEKMAKICFGDEDPIGKEVVCDNNLSFSVTGIVKNFPKNSSLEFDFLLPLAMTEKYGRDLASWDNSLIDTYILTNKSAEKSFLENKISNIIKKHKSDSPSTISLQEFTKSHLFAMDGGGLITYVYIFSAIAFFILLIASINFMNLSIAKSVTRAKEVGVRKSIGARKKELIIQHLFESVFMSTISVILSIFLILIALPVFNEISGKLFTISEMKVTFY